MKEKYQVEEFGRVVEHNDLFQYAEKLILIQTIEANNAMVVNVGIKNR